MAGKTYVYAAAPMAGKQLEISSRKGLLVISN